MVTMNTQQIHNFFIQFTDADQGQEFRQLLQQQGYNTSSTDDLPGGGSHDLLQVQVQWTDPTPQILGFYPLSITALEDPTLVFLQNINTTALVAAFLLELHNS